MDADTIRAIAKVLYKDMEELLSYLHDRWIDESEYEDFAEYAKTVEKQLTKLEPRAKFIKLTRRPFALHFSLGDWVYTLKVTNTVYALNRIK